MNFNQLGHITSNEKYKGVPAYSGILMRQLIHRGHWIVLISSAKHFRISETIIGQDSLSIHPILYLLAESCVFVKQSCFPILCFRYRFCLGYFSILDHLLANLRWHFVEFLKNPSLIALVFSTFSLVSDLVQLWKSMLFLAEILD